MLLTKKTFDEFIKKLNECNFEYHRIDGFKEYNKAKNKVDYIYITIDNDPDFKKIYEVWSRTADGQRDRLIKEKELKALRASLV